jgi:hypothetical protein
MINGLRALAGERQKAYVMKMALNFSGIFNGKKESFYSPTLGFWTRR